MAETFCPNPLQVVILRLANFHIDPTPTVPLSELLADLLIVLMPPYYFSLIVFGHSVD